MLDWYPPMSPISIAVLAVGMSIDSLLASVGGGASLRRQCRFCDAILVGAVFAIVQMITPLLGWAAGAAASSYVASFDHWLAFGLLTLVGGRMVLLAFRTEVEGAPETSFIGTPVTLVMTAIGTSIDAMAVGVSLAFVKANIIVIVAAIGATTFLMSAGGVMMGRLIGNRFGRSAEVVGGLVLIGLGCLILREHLWA